MQKEILHTSHILHRRALQCSGVHDYVWTDTVSLTAIKVHAGIAVQAFMTHELHKKVNTRLGHEQHLFSGGVAGSSDNVATKSKKAPGALQCPYTCRMCIT
jgi:hypothetical protein